MEWLPDPLAEQVEGVDPVHAYLGTLAAAVVALAGGAVAFPAQVYDRFIWKYFWGPVYADAHGSTCAVLTDGGVELYGSRAACAGEPAGAIIGYNAVNEVGYAATLLFGLVGVVLLLRRLEFGADRRFFYALLPFMFFGGALRVVEDANVAATEAGEAFVTFPWSALIISPLIYFTMFFLTLGALGAALAAERRGVVDGYGRPLATVGTALLAATLGFLLYLAFTTDYVSFLPQFTVVTLVGATAVAWASWWAVGEYAPGLTEGVGRIGFVLLWGHAVDGVANVVGLDWGRELGLSADLVGKHPVNRFVVDATDAVLPEAVTAITGTAWPFLLLKVAVVLLVLAIFDESVFEESPRYTILMLVAILAVGLGPGTRDMLRATFGI